VGPVIRSTRQTNSHKGAVAPTKAEQRKLKKAWASHAAGDLEVYLVSGYQNPRINAQSILARHVLIKKLFGDDYNDLMRAEFEFCVETNEAIRVRAAELGVDMQVWLNPAKRAETLEVCKVIADREDTFEKQWAKALSKRTVKTKLKVLEFACGSANDYRFLDAYGIARFLNYTGVDLNEKNIENAQRQFPGVDFQVQSILELPWRDRSFDYVLAFDIFEHLSIEAMESAMGEGLRLARQGVVFAFFIMADTAAHQVRPSGKYHLNELSAGKISELVAPTFTNVDLRHIPTLLRKESGAAHSYNAKAWTLIATGPINPIRRFINGQLLPRLRGLSRSK
jgi:SAM-dependent methyltransferase